MNTIIWNKYSKVDYYKNIDYLLEHWSEKVAQKFIDDVKHVLLLLKKGNVNFRETNIQNIYCCVINRHITLFYRYKNVDTIELLRFWNTNHNPKKLKI